MTLSTATHALARPAFGCRLLGVVVSCVASVAFNFVMLWALLIGDIFALMYIVPEIVVAGLLICLNRRNRASLCANLAVSVGVGILCGLAFDVCWFAAMIMTAQ